VTSLPRPRGVGPEVAGQLLTSAGDNPDQITSEAAFAHSGGARRSRPAAAASTDTDSTRSGTRRVSAPIARSIRCGCGRLGLQTLDLAGRVPLSPSRG